MATLADLRDRIIRETNREELLDAPSTDPTAANSDTLDQCIAKAIDYYADTRFSFNEGTVTLATVAGDPVVALPASVRQIDRLSYSLGVNRYGMQLRDYATIDQWLGYGGAAGQPNDYTVTTTGLRIYPVPDQAYPLTIIGIVNIATDFNNPDESNAWTNEAADLIAARARFLLNRDYFRDQTGALLAQGAEQQALTDLLGKTMKRIGTQRVRGSW